jgi:hypothetical protein
MQRDNFTCRECGATDKTLNVHHGYYTGGKNPWEYADETLHTVCEDCHERYEEIKHDLHLEIGKLSINGLFDLLSKVQYKKDLSEKIDYNTQKELWFEFFKYMDWEYQDFEEVPFISYDFKIIADGKEYLCFIDYEANSKEKRDYLFNLYGNSNVLLLSRNPFSYDNIPNAIGQLQTGDTIDDYEFCTAAVIEKDGKYSLTNLCEDIDFDSEYHEFCMPCWKVCINNININKL